MHYHEREQKGKNSHGFPRSGKNRRLEENWNSPLCQSVKWSICSGWNRGWRFCFRKIRFKIHDHMFKILMKWWFNPLRWVRPYTPPRQCFNKSQVHYKRLKPLLRKRRREWQCSQCKTQLRVGRQTIEQRRTLQYSKWRLQCHSHSWE